MPTRPLAGIGIARRTSTRVPIVAARSDALEVDVHGRLAGVLRSALTELRFVLWEGSTRHVPGAAFGEAGQGQ